jgi:hypothetical protein
LRLSFNALIADNAEEYRCCPSTLSCIGDVSYNVYYLRMDDKLELVDDGELRLPFVNSVKAIRHCDELASLNSNSDYS